MKKIVLRTALMSVMLTAQSMAGHFYAGPYIGMGSTNGKFNMVDLGNAVSRNNKVGANSFIGGLVAGYALPCNRLFFGGELFGNFDTTSTTIISERASAAVTDTIKLRHKATYGLAARFGLRTNSDVVLYARFGIEWSSNKINYVGIDTGTPFTLPAAKSKTSANFVPGIGIEAPLAAKWKARLEVKHSLSKSLRLRVPSSGSNLVYDNSALKLRATQTSAIMAVTYSF